MKQKIAILTQPLKTNYGGILQNYALQQVLKKNGHVPITIDRKYAQRSFLGTILSRYKQKVKRVLTANSVKIFSAKELNTIAKNSNVFISQNIRTTSKLNTQEKFDKHLSSAAYSTFIVGSDQVWRPKYSPNIYNYFLDFLEDDVTKKIAYAASFGTDEWEFSEIETKNIKALIEKFNGVSVREDAGVKLCSNFLDIKAYHVLDPTLLLEKMDYMILFKNLNLPENNGIYTYVLDRDDKKNSIITAIENKLDLTSFFCQPKTSILNPKSFNIEDYVYPKVEEWIKGFYDAKFVVTDSFHGTIFSIIFNKPFVAIVNKERGASRFESLLNLLGLQDRLVYNNDKKIINELIETPIDYKEVNDRLIKLKESSLNFLVKHI